MKLWISVSISACYPMLIYIGGDKPASLRPKYYTRRRYKFLTNVNPRARFKRAFDRRDATRIDDASTTRADSVLSLWLNLTHSLPFAVWLTRKSFGDVNSSPTSTERKLMFAVSRRVFLPRWWRKTRRSQIFIRSISLAYRYQKSNTSTPVSKSNTCHLIRSELAKTITLFDKI